MQVIKNYAEYATSMGASAWGSAESKETSTGSGAVFLYANKKFICLDQTAARNLKQWMTQSTGGGRQLDVCIIESKPHEVVAINKQTTATQRTLSEKLKFIKSIFGLQSTQLAEVMHVQRVTIYEWQRLDSMDSLRGINRARLNTLCEIAEAWSEFAPLSGKYLKEDIGDGETLMGLLRADIHDKSAILSTYRTLVLRKGPMVRANEHQMLQAENTKKIGAAFRSAFKQIKSTKIKG